MARDTSVCIFFKPPIAGNVKTPIDSTGGSTRCSRFSGSVLSGHLGCCRGTRMGDSNPRECRSVELRSSARSEAALMGSR